ncbi:hypothetical protein B0A53_02429 [Rhodotorula sp. CCFEE 5036]|nr:hypothetical protein B0A53_02429 [Rhodotorula sp. CCFEE 5036]
MPGRAQKQRRTRSRSPSLDPPRRATIKDLSEEAIDLVCAFIRDDEDAQVATETLCSLTRIARLFYSSAKRALLYDPTRALFRGDADFHWYRMCELQQKLLREPALGRHVRRLDTTPEYWYLLTQVGMSDLEYSNWILTLRLLCPSIFSLAVPVTLPDDSAAATAFLSLSKKLDLRHLLLALADDDDLVWDGSILRKCQGFLANLDLSQCDSLQLPPLDSDDVDDPDDPDRPPVSIPTRSFILQDCIEETGLLGLELDELTICSTARLPHLMSWDSESCPRFPRLTQLTLGKFHLGFRDLVDIVHRFPLLRVLDFTHSVWTGYASTARVWPESLRYLRHLRTLRTGTIRCETSGACKRLRDAITGYCNCNNISLICTAVPDLCACCGDSSEDEYNANEFEEQQDSSEDAEDGTEDVEEAGDDNDSAASDWLRTVGVADPDIPDYDRFTRDGISWHWVFDARGRPIAVPNDLAYYAPAAAFADEVAHSDDEDDIVAEACMQYLPPLPDEPRLEDGYQAHDDEDGDDFGPEPWLTWSEFCDFESADRAWVRFDIDEDGKEIGWIVGEFSEEESEDDELVSEEDCLSAGYRAPLSPLLRLLFKAPSLADTPIKPAQECPTTLESSGGRAPGRLRSILLDEPRSKTFAIETLCSLIRTARLFHSSAKRALLHDPTRALVNNKIVWLWHRMSSLMQELLRKPALGLHVKRLDYFPEYWYLLEVGGASDLDYSNWILTLDDEDELWSRCLNRCQDFLAGLDLSRCESLQLPPIDGENSGPPHRAPILISTKCLIVQECFEVSDPDFLSRYFDLRNLTLHSFVLDLGDLVDIVRRFPVIRSLDFTRNASDRNYLLQKHQRLHTNPQGHHRQRVGDFEDQQNRSEDDDGDWVISDWLRGVSVADSDVPDCERFNRDGVPWHWVFDARGRPTAVPDDLAFYPPAAASADEAALSDDEDDVGTEASVEYLPPFPDAPRLEDGYEAHDADDDDGEGDGFGPEPWLTWSEFCDFDAADSAWVRFDIDDEGEEMSSSEGEVNAEEECESEDDELVSEDGLPPRF